MSKSSGYQDEVVGKVKENVGWATGNEGMEVKGKAQYAKGATEVEAAKAQERMKGTGEELKGGFKETAGKVLGNEQMEYEGKGSKLTGEARKAANQ
jgi:uncharacterized protein YjbJ (UPF0337 family)